MRLRNFNWIISISLLLASQSCGVYSMTGASISSDVKTISIQQFINNATLGPPTMTAIFTQELRDYFLQNTSLIMVKESGDLQFDGFISDYTITPVTANSSGNDSQADLSALSRITITISCNFTNTKDPTYDFDRKFSFFKDFDSSEDLSSNEEEYIKEVFNQIILDIFNSSVANW